MNMKARAKIVASIGPASTDRQILKSMVEAGMNVIRLNFSHGDYNEQESRIDLIRSIQNELNVNLAIIGDLSGPKLRLGILPKEKITVFAGDMVKFYTKARETDECQHAFEVSYERFAEDVNPGDRILIDDGKIKLEATETDGKTEVLAKVIYGGDVSSRKGINLPDSILSMPSLTDKDKQDVLFAIEHKLDWLALSFVRKPEDITCLREHIESFYGTQGIIAKIEKPEAVKNIDQIIEVSDGIMVARGDLGVEVDFNKVPVIQKQIVSKCVNMAKPVIIATQMLDSMIYNFRPTRAEANDVANAVMDLADAVMLSGETAIGKYPVESVHSMQEIINHTEEAGVRFNRNHAPHDMNEHFIPDSVCYNAFKMAQQTDAKAIIPFSYSGYTAYRISSHRPKAAIYAFTYNKPLMKRLPMVWGISTYYFPVFNDIDKAIAYSIDVLKKEGLLESGDVVIHVGSTPLTAKAETNMIKLSIVD
ncbi:MAG: pyruvate kinase [Bacteroidales bacterium]|jgi:pyruvate kinase|nr:pyruvate kinase [Bacteroidales bacterium]